MTHRSFSNQSLHYFDRPHAGLPRAPIDSPAAWLGRDLRDEESSWRVRLDARAVEEIERALDRLDAAGRSLASIDGRADELPRVAARAAQWRNALVHGLGFLVIGGLPVDRWGDERSARAFWLLGHQLGVPGAQNPAGELLGHVVDSGEQPSAPHVRLYRTASEIGFHCDAADVVGLLCLRAAPVGGDSRIASSVAIFNAIFEEDPDLAAELFEPFAVDRRDEQPEGARAFFEIPPARFDAERQLRTFYHSEYFRSVARLPEIGRLPARRLQLIDRYDALAASDDFRLDMRLSPGDMQLVSNHTIVHARSVYTDDPDPAKRRHLLRLWLSLDPPARERREA